MTPRHTKHESMLKGACWRKSVIYTVYTANAYSEQKAKKREMIVWTEILKVELLKKVKNLKKKKTRISKISKKNENLK